MSLSKSEIKRNHKVATIASAIALIAFLGVAGFATISVTSIASIIEGKILANKDGVPEAWEKYGERDSVQVSTDGVVSGDFVEYTTAVKNTDNIDVVTLTHLSSYIAEEGTRGGFVPLAEDTLEYTYSPDVENSWTPVKISAPSNNSDGYKLESALYIGKDGSNTDTIYFRYNVAPTESGTVNDKVAFVTTDYKGEVAVSASDASVEYQKEEVKDDEPVDSGEDGAYAKPLGVFSKAPSTSVVNASSLGAISVSQETVTPSLIIMFVALGIFATSLIVYMVIRNKNTKQSKN